MKNLCLSLLMYLLTSCSRESMEDKLSDRHMSAFGKEVQKTDKLYLVGTGGSARYGIDKLSLTFISYTTPSIDQARKLYLDIVNRFIARINEDEEIHPYLIDYPMTHRDLKICILFSGLPESEMADYVTVISMGEYGKKFEEKPIYYFKYDYEQQRSNIFFEETFEEAVENLKLENSLNKAKL